MGEKKKIYRSLVDGATEGLFDTKLHAYVLEACPFATNGKIVKAAMLALSDPSLRDRHILNTIFALAIKIRTSGRASFDPEFHANVTGYLHIITDEDRGETASR